MKLFGFQWHVTDRCDLRCAHCYQDVFSPRTEQQIEALRAMADRIFTSLPGHRISVNVTGGEPLLMPGIVDLLRHIDEFPNLEEMHLITNGMVVTPPVLEAIASLPKLRCLKVSIEAGEADLNDSVRGPGTFERVAANLPLFLKTGKAVVLMATLARYNVGAIDGLVRFAREAGAAGVIFERFVPLGRGTRLTGQVLGPRDWEATVAAIVSIAGLDTDPLDLLSYRAFWYRFEDDDLVGALCNLGAESMALMPDGAVFPCRRLSVPVGNILADPFEEILRRLAAYHPSTVRDHLVGDLCGNCGEPGCVGCRALARALTGDMLADDPQCPLQDGPADTGGAP